MKNILIIIIVLLFCDIAHAIDYDTQTGQYYGGYAVVLNGETGEGFVYVNSARTSLLVVFYPSKNKVFVYSTEGQNIYFADDMRDFILKYGLTPGSLVSIIKSTK